jgi:hypothetical protein
MSAFIYPAILNSGWLGKKIPSDITIKAIINTLVIRRWLRSIYPRVLGIGSGG